MWIYLQNVDFCANRSIYFKDGRKDWNGVFWHERQCPNLIFTVWCKFLCILEITLKATNILEKVVSYILQQITNLWHNSSSDWSCCCVFEQNNSVIQTKWHKNCSEFFYIFYWIENYLFVFRLKENLEDFFWKGRVQIVKVVDCTKDKRSCITYFHSEDYYQNKTYWYLFIHDMKPFPFPRF